METVHEPLLTRCFEVTPSSVPSKPRSATTPGGGGELARLCREGGGGEKLGTMSTRRSSKEYDPMLSPTW